MQHTDSLGIPWFIWKNSHVLQWSSYSYSYNVWCKKLSAGSSFKLTESFESSDLFLCHTVHDLYLRNVGESLKGCDI